MITKEIYNDIMSEIDLKKGVSPKQVDRLVMYKYKKSLSHNEKLAFMMLAEYCADFREKERNNWWKNPNDPTDKRYSKDELKDIINQKHDKIMKCLLGKISLDTEQEGV